MKIRTRWARIRILVFLLVAVLLLYVTSAWSSRDVKHLKTNRTLKEWGADIVQNHDSAKSENPLTVGHDQPSNMGSRIQEKEGKPYVNVEQVNTNRDIIPPDAGQALNNAAGNGMATYRKLVAIAMNDLPEKMNNGIGDARRMITSAGNEAIVEQANIDNGLQDKIAENTKQHATEDNQVKQSVFIDPVLYVNSTNEIAKTHSILMWNPPGWMFNWFADLDLNQCAYKNCKMIFNKDEFQKSSAVMFSIGDKGMGPRPPISAATRNPDQAWIFYSLESPIHIRLSKYNDPQWNQAMNWSWTYRTDADIFHPYGILQTRLEPPTKNYTAIFRQKTKMAAWAVSHCSTQSRREEYVKLMSNYTQVDIYGRCGRHYPNDFKQVIERDYKFYMGFENSICQDYVTEKTFNYYKRDIITVVRGGIDYKKYLPDGSYINAADFSSAKELTDFMKKLGSDEEEYIKYLKRKDKYSVKERDYVFRDAMCNICNKLNNLDKYRKSYDDFIKWMGTCTSPTDVH